MNNSKKILCKDKSTYKAFVNFSPSSYIKKSINIILLLDSYSENEHILFDNV